MMQKYSRAAHLYAVRIDGDSRSRITRVASGLRWRSHRVTDRREWFEQADGCYLLRTNLEGYDAPTLWKTYIGLTQIEDCFRITKHALGLRPIPHRREDRTQAHILVCFLSLVLWRTLQQWMAASGLRTAPRKLLEELAEVRSLDIILPTKAGRPIRLRTVSKPEKHLAILLQRLSLPLPNQSKRVQNVVQTIAEKKRKIPANGEVLPLNCRKRASKPTAKVLWRGSNKLGVAGTLNTPFLQEGHIYASGDQGVYRCVKMETGQRIWETSKPTTKAKTHIWANAFTIKNGDRFFLANDLGDLIIAKLTVDGYQELDRCHLLEPTGKAGGREMVWSHPAFANKRIYARNDKEIICVSLAINETNTKQRSKE